MTRDAIGFGEPSRRAATHNGNWFARFATVPVHGGCDVTVTARRGLVIDRVETGDGGREVTLRLRLPHHGGDGR
jgi:hypothetical protein